MRFLHLQTCFDYRLVIVVARGAAKEGLDYIYKKLSESDQIQKSAARCVTACGGPKPRSSQSCSQPPAVTKSSLCGLLEVSTEAASLGSSLVARQVW